VSGSGISRVICKSAPRSRQITMPVPHHSVFYRPDALPVAQPTASKHWSHPVDLYNGHKTGGCCCTYLEVSSMWMFRLDTDMLLAGRCGLWSLLVLTGFSTLQQARDKSSSSSEDDRKQVPDFYLPSLGDLAPFLGWCQVSSVCVEMFFLTLCRFNNQLIIVFFVFFQQSELRWYGYVLQKEDNNWLKKFILYDVEGSRLGGRPKMTWREVVEKHCQACKLNEEDAMNRSDQDRGEWMNVSSVTSPPRLFVPDKGPLNSCVCVSMFLDV